jgi:hypothetical protein
MIWGVVTISRIIIIILQWKCGSIFLLVHLETLNLNQVSVLALCYNRIFIFLLHAFNIDNRPKVFISFSRRKTYDDSPDAQAEAKDLYTELKAQGCRPWMDERGLEYGDVLAKEIFWAIKQCDFIIPIMTGGYATSLWCLRELYYAALQKDRKKTIIPMILEDEAIIGDQKSGKWLLRMGTGQKYFKPEEKDAMIKSLKEKVFLFYPHMY